MAGHIAASVYEAGENVGRTIGDYLDQGRRTLQRWQIEALEEDRRNNPYDDMPVDMNNNIVQGEHKAEESEQGGAAGGIAKLEYHPALMQASRGVHKRMFKKTFFLQFDNTQMTHAMMGTGVATTPPTFLYDHILPGLDLPLNQILFYISRGELLAIKTQNMAYKYGEARSKISNIAIRTEQLTGTGDTQITSHHIEMPDVFVYDRRHTAQQFPWKSWYQTPGAMGSTFSEALVTGYNGSGTQLIANCLEATLYGQLQLYPADVGPDHYPNQVNPSVASTAGNPLNMNLFPTLLSAEAQYTFWPFRASEFWDSFQMQDMIKPSIHGESCPDGGCWEFPPIKSDGRWRGFRAAEQYAWSGNTAAANMATILTQPYPVEGVANPTTSYACKMPIAHHNLDHSCLDVVRNSFANEFDLYETGAPARVGPHLNGDHPAINAYGMPHEACGDDPGVHVLGYMVPENSLNQALNVVGTFRLDTEMEVICMPMIEERGMPELRFFQKPIAGAGTNAVSSRYTLPQWNFHHVKRQPMVGVSTVGFATANGIIAAPGMGAKSVQGVWQAASSAFGGTVAPSTLGYDLAGLNATLEDTLETRSVGQDATDAAPKRKAARL